MHHSGVFNQKLSKRRANCYSYCNGAKSGTSMSDKSCETVKVSGFLAVKTALKPLPNEGFLAEAMTFSLAK